MANARYAINYVLGSQAHVLVISATDNDDAYDKARDWIMKSKLFSAALQGSCRVACQDDIDQASEELS